MALALLLGFYCCICSFLAVEKASDAGGERGVRGDVSDEIGTSVGSAEEAGRLVVGTSSLLRGFKGSEPHPDLLRRVFDLSNPPPGGPLPNSDEFVVVVVVFSWFGFAGKLWFVLVLEVDFHWEKALRWGFWLCCEVMCMCMCLYIDELCLFSLRWFN